MFLEYCFTLSRMKIYSVTGEKTSVICYDVVHCIIRLISSWPSVSGHHNTDFHHSSMSPLTDNILSKCITLSKNDIVTWHHVMIDMADMTFVTICTSRCIVSLYRPEEHVFVNPIAGLSLNTICRCRQRRCFCPTVQPFSLSSDLCSRSGMFCINFLAAVVGQIGTEQSNSSHLYDSSGQCSARYHHCWCCI